MAIEVLDRGAVIAAGTIVMSATGNQGACDVRSQGVRSAAGVGSGVNLTLVDKVAETEFNGQISAGTILGLGTSNPQISWVDEQTVKLDGVAANGIYHFVVIKLPQPTVFETT
jgi:hypothetical protein